MDCCIAKLKRKEFAISEQGIEHHFFGAIHIFKTHSTTEISLINYLIDMVVDLVKVDR